MASTVGLPCSPQEKQVIGAIMTAEEDLPDATDGSPNPKAEYEGASAAQPASRSLWGPFNVIFQPARLAKPPKVLQTRAVVEKSNWALRMLCVASAVSLFAASVLSVLNVFESYLSPLQNLLALYNILLSTAVFVAEGRKRWFRRCGDVQNGLFRRVTVLGSQPGRAVLYFYVGSVCLLMLPNSLAWKFIYLSLGAAFCLMSGLSALDSNAGDFDAAPATREPSVDEEAPAAQKLREAELLALPAAAHFV